MAKGVEELESKTKMITKLLKMSFVAVPWLGVRSGEPGDGRRRDEERC